MFTGLIESVGTVAEARRERGGLKLTVRSELQPFEVAAGDSVSVSGVCLTAVEITQDGFAADVSSESLSRSTLAELRPGDKVNLERALRLGDRLGGHIVTGHIDGVGTIERMEPQEEFTRVTFRAPEDAMRYLVEKGSIAVDGVSLTVNGVGLGRFWVMIIPETLKRTTLADKRNGLKVNLEADVLGKYVEKLLGKYGKDSAMLRKLREEGYL